MTPHGEHPRRSAFSERRSLLPKTRAEVVRAVGERKLLVAPHGQPDKGIVVETDQAYSYKPGQEIAFTWNGVRLERDGSHVHKVVVHGFQPIETKKGDLPTEAQRRAFGLARYDPKLAPKGESDAPGAPEESGDGKKKKKEKRNDEGGFDPAAAPLDAPPDAEMTAEEHVLRELAEATPVPTKTRERARRAEGRPTGTGVLSYRRERGFFVRGSDGAEVELVAHGALPGDEVEFALATHDRRAEVLSVKKRFPHALVGTVRTEQRQKRKKRDTDPMLFEQVVTFYPDGAELPVPPTGFPLPEGFSTMDFNVDKKVRLRREPDPTADEWTLDKSIGDAGDTAVEIRAIAERTPNGSRRVEELTDEDLRAYRDSLDEAEFPELCRQLEGVTAEALKAQIAELEALERSIEEGQLSLEALIQQQLGVSSSGEALLPTSFDAYRHGENRLDFREVQTFAIDPSTAKDHDDALSYRVLGDGSIEIGVHIADPTAFIKPGSPLDVIAKFRQKTQYLRSLTLPLFAEALSNELCSLKEGKERLAFSTVFTFPPKESWPDGTAPTPKVWHGRTVIRSDKQFAYEEAQAALTAGTGPFADALSITKLLGAAYRKERTDRGYADLTTVNEVDYTVDDRGRPVSASESERLDSMRLIEDWMIRANETVTASILESAPGAVDFLRVHDAPQLGNLEAALAGMGYRDLIPKKGSAYEPRALIQAVRKRLDEEPRAERTKKERILVRAMERAGYRVTSMSEEHWATALARYGHYTSPIRRYPDIVKHRLLSDVLAGRPVTIDNEATVKELSEVARMTNVRERELDRNERDARIVLGLALLESKGVVNNEVQARILEHTPEGLFLEFSLPGGAKFRYALRRSEITVEIPDTEHGAAGEGEGEGTRVKDFTPAQWKMLAEGTEQRFGVDRIDVARRRMHLTFDPDRVIRAREEERFARLPDGTSLGLVVESGGESSFGSLYMGKERVARTFALGAETIRHADGRALSEDDWASLQPPEDGERPRAAVVLRRRGDQVRLELVRIHRRERPNPFAGFRERYLGKRITGKVTAVSEEEIIVDLHTRPMVRRYSLKRAAFRGVPEPLWKGAVVGSAIEFKVLRVDEEKRRLTLEWQGPSRGGDGGKDRGPREGGRAGGRDGRQGGGPRPPRKSRRGG